MTSYQMTYDEFVEGVTRAYEATAHVAHSEIVAISAVEVASGPFARKETGIAFTGRHGKSLHGPTLVVAFTKVAGDHLLEDLLFHWTETTGPAGLVVAFPGLTYDRFSVPS